MGVRALVAAGVLVAGALTGTLTAPGAAGADSCDSAAATDFNGDGHNDVAVGDYRANVADMVAAGAVAVLYGDDEIDDGDWTTLTEDTPGVTSGPSPNTGAASGDGFGWSITTAHVDADRCLDLVVGAPWRDDGGRVDAGAVYVVFGSPDGLGKGRPGLLLRPGDWGPAQTGQLFGWSLGGADASGTDGSAVAIGAPYEDRPPKSGDGSGSIRDAGAVHVAWFGSDGAPATRKSFGQDFKSFPGIPEEGDLFGWAVLLGSTGGNAGQRDLITSEPFEDVNGEGTNAGSVSVLNDISGPADKVTLEHWHYGNIDVPPVSNGEIGYSLAYVEDGNTRYVAAGIPGQTVNGHQGAGAVKMFTSTGSGLKPAELLSKTDGAAGDRFGLSVALADSAVTGAGTQLAVGAPNANGQRGFAQLVPLANPDQSVRLEAGSAGVPGSAAAGAHFGQSVAFAGDRSAGGALLVGVPDDRQKVTGSIVVRPFDGKPSRFVPDDIGIPPADLTDFGGSFSGTSNNRK
jgi:hypothetical protein